MIKADRFAEVQAASKRLQGGGLADAINVSDNKTKGVGVAQAQPGSAADRAGLKKGDVITAFNGVEVSEPNVFRNLVASTAPGSDVTLNVLRDGRELQMHATLGELMPTPDQPR